MDNLTYLHLAADPAKMRAHVEALETRVTELERPAPHTQPSKFYHFIIGEEGPSHNAGRFVEVENDVGASINAGEWHKRPDGLWDLMVPDHRDDLARAEDRIADLETSAYEVVECPDCRGAGWHTGIQQTESGNPVPMQVPCEACDCGGRIQVLVRELLAHAHERIATLERTTREHEQHLTEHQHGHCDACEKDFNSTEAAALRKQLTSTQNALKAAIDGLCDKACVPCFEDTNGEMVPVTAMLPKANS